MISVLVLQYFVNETEDEQLKENKSVCQTFPCASRVKVTRRAIV